jgi:hypothetical protein
MTEHLDLDERSRTLKIFMCPRLLYSDLSKQSRIDKFSELVIGSNPFSESLLTRIAGSLGNQSTNRGALYLYLQMAWTDRSAIL